MGRPKTKRKKIVSVLEASELLGVTRSTITGWLNAGAPYVSKPEDGESTSWELDLGQIMLWRIERETERGVKKALDAAGAGDGSGRGGPPEEWSADEAKRRKAVADALIQELRLDREAERVAPIDDTAAEVAAEYAEVRDGFLGLGPRAAPRLVGQTDPAVIAEILRGYVDEILAKLQADRRLARRAETAVAASEKE